MGKVRRSSRSGSLSNGFFLGGGGYFPYAAILGLTLTIGFLAFTRGGYYRLYWAPAGVAVPFLFCVFGVLVNHGGLKARWKAGPDVALLAFLGAGLFSYVNSIKREATFFRAVQFSTEVMCYFLAGYGVQGERARKVFAFSLFGIGFLEAVYGIGGFISGRQLVQPEWVELVPAMGKVCGTFRNSNHFAGLLEMLIFLGLGLGLGLREEEDRGSERIASGLFFLVPCGLMILALAFSLSRGGWVSFAAGFLFFLGLVWWRRHRVWSWFAVGAVVLMLVTGSVFMGVNRGPLYQEFQSLADALRDPGEISDDGRLSLWRSSLEMAAAHPFFGTGWGTFHSAYPGYRGEGMFKGPDFAHNDYLQLAAETGVFGLLCFLGFVVMVFREGLAVVGSRGRDFWARAMPGLLAGLFSLLVHEVVDFNLLIPSNAMIFFALAGMAAGWSGRGNETARA